MDTLAYQYHRFTDYKVEIVIWLNKPYFSSTLEYGVKLKEHYDITTSKLKYHGEHN
jgi:hypothetical protein